MKRNINFELIKFISAIGVIIIHYTAYIDTKVVVTEPLNLLFRFAVPIFFMVSGYFYSNKTKSVFKNLKVYIALFIIYGIFITNILGIAYTFIWFMGALTAIQFLTLKVNNKKRKQVVFITSLMLYIVFKYVLGHGANHDNIFKTSINDVILMLPVFTFGMLLREYDVKIKTNNILVIIIVIVLEVINVFTLKANQTDLFQYLMAVLLFISLKDINFAWIKKYEIILTLSFYIYISHIFVIGITETFTTNIINSATFINLNYVLMMLFTIMLTIICSFILRNILNKLNINI